MIRESQWLVGVVLASIVAGALFAAAAATSPGERATAFWAALAVATAVAVVANVFGYAVPRYQGTTGRARTRARRVMRRVERHDNAGAEALWLVAGLAIAAVAVQPAVHPALLALGALAFLSATVAWLWGDFVQPAVEAPPDNRRAHHSR